MVLAENNEESRIRFPRFGTGEQITRLMQLAWERHEMRVEETGEFTEIVFRIPVQREFKKRIPALHKTLFEGAEASWTEIFIPSIPIGELRR